MNNLQPKKDSTFYKTTVAIGKILILVGLAYFSIGLFFTENRIQLIIGFFILIFITLPTLFLFFFKEKFLANHPKFIGLWKIIRVIYVISIILYATFWILGSWHLNETAKTQKTIDFINSKKITLNDVMGKNLPPIPDQKLNNSTVAGIDANKNYIRDDVELAIFKQYPNSAEIRAAELQYAQSLQLELTQVYSSKTLVAVMKKESHAIDCIGQNGPDISLKDSREKIIAALAVTDNMQKEVEGLALNTDLRKKENSNILEKYMTGYASLPGNECDIELSSLPN